jgi:hypothetical protein
MAQTRATVRNQLIGTLSARDRDCLRDCLHVVTIASGQILFEPGEDVTAVHFPGEGVIASLVLTMRNGASAEAALIGMEGAVGGIVSAGEKPAFTRGVVQVGGPALQLSTDDLEAARNASETLRDHFARYADCLLAQVLQSVACNAIHDFEARLARWLLATHDRIRQDELEITQDFVAEMLGAQRTYVTRIIGALAETGAIRTARGSITIIDRRKLEAQSCECYAYLRRHFERILPGVYPGAGR